DPRQGYAGRAAGRNDHCMRRVELNWPVLEIDDDPVQALRHDLHRLDRGDGGDGTKGGTPLAPLLLETVEGTGRFRHRQANSEIIRPARGRRRSVSASGSNRADASR